MSWATIQALLQLAPLVIKFFQSVENYVLLKMGEGKGRAEATAEALNIGITEIGEAAKAIAEAEADHTAHPEDDSGFDNTFRRKD